MISCVTYQNSKLIIKSNMASGEQFKSMINSRSMSNPKQKQVNPSKLFSINSSSEIMKKSQGFDGWNPFLSSPWLAVTIPIALFCFGCAPLFLFLESLFQIFEHLIAVSPNHTTKFWSYWIMKKSIRMSMNLKMERKLHEALSAFQSSLPWTKLGNLLLCLFIEKKRQCDDCEVTIKGKEKEQLFYLLSQENLCGSAECVFTAFYKIMLTAKE